MCCYCGEIHLINMDTVRENVLEAKILERVNTESLYLKH